MNDKYVHLKFERKIYYNFVDYLSQYEKTAVDTTQRNFTNCILGEKELNNDYLKTNNNFHL